MGTDGYIEYLQGTGGPLQNGLGIGCSNSWGSAILIPTKKPFAAEAPCKFQWGHPQSRNSKAQTAHPVFLGKSAGCVFNELFFYILSKRLTYSFHAWRRGFEPGTCNNTYVEGCVEDMARGSIHLKLKIIYNQWITFRLRTHLWYSQRRQVSC